MKNIAITGSFASGKSFVLDCAHRLGYKVFSCDSFIHNAYKDIELQNTIVNKIEGLNYFNKRDLSRIIYSNAKSRKILESIVHPIVRSGISHFESKNTKYRVIFTEVPLLFESNFDQHFFSSVCVYCKKETRLSRLKERKFYDIDLYNKIEQIQFDQSEKMKKSKFVINSDTTRSQIEFSLIKIIQKVICL